MDQAAPLPSPPGSKLIPDWLFAPISSAMLIAVAGVVGLEFGQPWIFASLGPTAFQLSEYPDHKSARLYNVLVGHGLGLAMGFAALALFNSWNAPKVLATHDLTAIRVWTCVVAMFLTAMGILLLRASHPPAGSTSLLVALGSFQNAHGALTILIGVTIVGLTGELFKLLRLAMLRRQPVIASNTHML